MLRLSGLATQAGGRVLHHDIDLDLRAGEVLGVVGASGAGKSVLLKTIVGIMPRAAGSIELFGEMLPVHEPDFGAPGEQRWGVMFQDGALFSSLSVGENIALPIKERLDLPAALVEELCALKAALVGLPPESVRQYPASLSGGMRKRAGLARALALDPPLLFLDEPTAGLDPIAANDFDGLVRDLKEGLGLTVFMVTHDLDSLIAIADRIAVLIDNHIRIGTMADMLADPHPWIHAYFHGPRARAAFGAGRP